MIEEARARQRRHRRLAAAATILAASIAAIVLASAGGGGGSHSAGVPARPGRPPSQVARAALASCVSGRGRLLQGAPSQSLLSILGVLRRPAMPADALPPAIRQNILRGGFGGDVFVNYIRRARVIDGTTYYIYPVVTRGCGSLSGHEGIWELASHIDLGHGFYGGGGGGGESAAMIEAGEGAVTGPPGISGQPHSSGTIDLVVPDGVASVTLQYPPAPANGFHPKVISPGFTVTAAPVNNLLVVNVPRSSGGGPIRRATMIWRAANGHILKTFDRI